MNEIYIVKQFMQFNSFFWQFSTNFFLLVLILIVLWLYWKDKKNYVFYFGFLTIVYLFKKIISFFYIRPRPYLILNTNNYFHLTNSSFFSMHSFLAVFSMLYIIRKSKSIVFNVIVFIFTLIIIFSRLILGVHYLSDVIFAVFLAVFCFISERYVAEKIRKSSFF